MSDPIQLAVEVDGLTKRYRGGRPSMVPVPSLIPGRRRSSRLERRREEPIEDIDDDDDYAVDEIDEEEREEERPDRAVWALREISLEVRPGTVLGIVGPNGAGKSTLLRVLTRLTPPTEGTVVVRGRVAPLVPILPGLMLRRDSLRSNVVHVAKFYGIPDPKAVAAAQTDAVAEFAELEGQLDQRVSSLSTGELQRFAFAVALHLEPDILIADEVIAGGDRHFQRRCLEYIREQAERGLTVLFATHQLDLVRDLCPEAILMEAGRIVERGPSTAVVDRYERVSVATRAPRDSNGDSRRSPGQPDTGPLQSAGLFSIAGVPVTALHVSEAGLIEILLHVSEAPTTIRCTLILRGADTVTRSTQPTPFTVGEVGRYVVSAYVPAAALEDGMYRVEVTVAEFTAEGRRPLGRLRDAFELEVYGIPDQPEEPEESDAEPEESDADTLPSKGRRSRLNLTWSVSRIDDRGRAPSHASP